MCTYSIAESSIYPKQNLVKESSYFSLEDLVWLFCVLILLSLCPFIICFSLFYATMWGFSMYFNFKKPSHSNFVVIQVVFETFDKFPPWCVFGGIFSDHFWIVFISTFILIICKMMCLDKASKISHLLIGTYVINNPHHIGSPVAVTVGCFGCVYSLYCRADFS